MKIAALVIVLGLVAVLFLVRVPCAECNGKGSLKAEAVQLTCRHCRGTGKSRPALSGSGDVKPLGTVERTCLHCRGKGTTMKRAGEDRTCPACNGDGKVTVFDRIRQADWMP